MGTGEPQLEPGKLPAALLQRLLDMPDVPPDVRVAPAVGEDAAAIDVPAGALVVATDPITLTSGDIGRYAVVINANDVAVTGAAPRWFLAAVLLPPDTSSADVEGIFDELRGALAEVGATLVGGHTEITAAVNQPVVVGQMLGHVPAERVVATAGANVGDVVVQIGPVPVEGAAVLAAAHGEALDGLASGVLEAARRAPSDPGISVVVPALLAADLGATSLHDPTEGGLASGLHEITAAAGVALVVDPEAVLWFEPGREVCEAVGADVWATLASGCVLATFPRPVAAEAVRSLVRAGHPTAILGTVESGEGVSLIGEGELVWPERDEAARLGG